MKLEALDHPKTLDFASRLNVELPTAIGYLELLWAFTGKKAPEGNVGKWPDGAIARACYWMGDAKVFVGALVGTGFIEADATHRLVIHDWHDHAPGWVRAKLKKLNLAFLSLERTSEPSLERTSEASSEPSLEPSIQGKGSTREGKGSTTHVVGLDVPSWNRWLEYRREIRKPLKQASIPAAQLALAAFGSDQPAVVEQTIANSWQGLFALKDKPKNGKQEWY